MKNQTGLLVSIVLIAFVAAAFFAIYAFTPFTIGWVMFIVFAVCFASNMQPKDTIWTLLAMACGIGWGLLYNYTIMGLSMFMDPVIALFLGIVIITVIACVVHMMLFGATPLGKTSLTHVPYVFVPVSLLFSPAGANLPELSITLAMGVLATLLCVLGMNWAMKKWPMTTPEETGETSSELDTVK